jgi:hypothetical protein
VERSATAIEVRPVILSGGLHGETEKIWQSLSSNVASLLDIPVLLHCAPLQLRRAPLYNEASLYTAFN